MTHDLTILLINTTFYIAVASWLALGIWLLVGLVAANRESLLRAGKYLVNSAVFLVAYAFYVELAVIVRPPVEAPKLREWAAQQLVADLWIAASVVVILSLINIFFYYIIEKRRHKMDLLVLTVFDMIVLVGGACLAGQDAYFGLLEEAHRSL